MKLSDRAIFSQKNLALNLLAIFPTELFQTDLLILTTGSYFLNGILGKVTQLGGIAKITNINS